MITVNIADTQLTDAEIEAAVAVLKSGALRQGKACQALEEDFAKKVGVKHAISCANGSAALHLAYMDQLSPGDEVLVPAFTFIATASMVCAAQGTPVLCDVDRDSYLIDLADCAKKLTPKTKAIAPVHLFGNVCDVDAITEFAREHKLTIIWDAAQAHGGVYDGKDVGAFDDLVCYSFYPTKNMFVGEGGMITTNDDAVAERLRFLKSHGQTGKYLHTMLGLNYRMTDVEGAIGHAQLQRLDEMIARRRRNGRLINEGIARIPGLTPQAALANTKHAYHQYCLTVDADAYGCDRDQLLAELKKRGVATGVHYPRSLNQQPIFVDLLGPQSCPVSEGLCKCIFALPVHHQLTDDEIGHIITSLIEIHQQHKA